jgi:Ni/Fe-hydrogenase subunit HybB-like protein
LLIVLGLSVFVIAFLVLLGGPISLFILRKLNQNGSGSFILFITFSIVVGFGLSGLIASWSYGIFGINRYVMISVVASLLMWLFVIIKYRISPYSF